MPERTSISKVIIIGSGPIVIGQGSEYDAAALEACKALREVGVETVIVNSNPVTASTARSVADQVYIEPLTVSSVKMIIEKEKPDAMLATFGGQSALYLASELEREGVLAANGVKLIGLGGSGARQFGDPVMYKEIALAAGMPIRRSGVADSIESAMQMVREIGLPVAIRPAFTPGGGGSGIAYNVEEFVSMIGFALKMSPSRQVTLEEPVLGWKQVEMVVVRDSAGSVVTVTDIEALNPAGVHPGNSPEVVPVQTLGESTVLDMESVAGKVMRGFDITGAATVSFAVSQSGDVVVLGVDPSAGRCVALASRATGLAVAGVSAKLAVGVSVGEACKGYAGGVAGRVLVKMPRFAFEKFPGAELTLGTSMTAFGESVAFGGSFVEALQKSVRALDTGRLGLACDGGEPASESASVVPEGLTRPTEQRLFYIRCAIEQGVGVDEIAELSGVDAWFIERIGELVSFEKKFAGKSLVGVPADVLLEAKRLGYSDAQLAVLLETDEDQVSVRRNVLGIKTGAGTVDGACYLTYSEAAQACSRSDARKVVLLGGGATRIGQGAEFDVAVTQAAAALAGEGYTPIVVNCEPSAVSMSSMNPGGRYIAPLTREDVMDIIEREQPEGVIVGFGGQVALSLGRALAKAKVPVLGTPMKSIERIMSRRAFIDMLSKLEQRQLANEWASSVPDALEKAEKLGYPVLVRPGRIHTGRERVIVYDADDMAAFVEAALLASPDGTVVMYKFLEDATEVSVDAIGDGENVIVCGVMEHIEQAGVHAGDSACSLPPHSLSDELVADIKRQTRALGAEMGIRGLLGVRYAVKDGQLYVLAINPRTTRTIPFVSKATGIAWAEVAARVAVGKSLRDQGITEDPAPKHVSVKEAVFPFVRFPGADVVLGPDMKSTGQVMGINAAFGSAYIKAQVAADQDLPKAGTVFLSLADRDKRELNEIGKRLRELGFEIVATRGTARSLNEAGVETKSIAKIEEGRPDATDLIKNGDIDLIINTRSGKKPRSHEITIRGAVVARGIPIITTIAGAKATLFGMETMLSHGESVRSLAEYVD